MSPSTSVGSMDIGFTEGSSPPDASGCVADPNIRRIVRAILHAPSAFYSADGFARSVGLLDRHRLNRCLRRAGLPNFRAITAFGRILSMRDSAQMLGRSICAHAIRQNIDPAWIYRTIYRLTGKRWSVLEALSREQFIELGLHVPASVWLGEGYYQVWAGCGVTPDVQEEAISPSITARSSCLGR